MPGVHDRELETYERRKDELLETSTGKFALIHDGDVAGVFESKQDAINEGYARFGNVPFLVKHIVAVETPENFVSNHLAV